MLWWPVLTGPERWTPRPWWPALAATPLVGRRDRAPDAGGNAFGGAAGWIIAGVTVSRNLFASTGKGLIADVFNNLYENWLSRTIDAHDYSRVIVEQNVFRSVTTTSAAFTDSGVNAYLWARTHELRHGARLGARTIRLGAGRERCPRRDAGEAAL
jgi:hypothetical protein